MKVFLDANILVSVLNKEYPVFTYSSRVLSLADNSKYKFYTSPLCLAIAYYFAEKKCGNAQARHKIDVLINKLQITTVNDKTVRETSLNKKIHDFEDGLQYYSALESYQDIIITRNQKDFKSSQLAVMSAEEYLSSLS